ncbi:hypothetical protein X801_03765 [Opisthorchis viverrini]|uniref:Uncharacterized protein n=1 Tax=Opisthorchis viverrini TaxID=6198 RepID=A0A1S8X0Y3_OPIVI|nr:hypothetical protein X801_03765 [Opisthorchis viverrini]
MENEDEKSAAVKTSQLHATAEDVYNGTTYDNSDISETQSGLLKDSYVCIKLDKYAILWQDHGKARKLAVLSPHCWCCIVKVGCKPSLTKWGTRISLPTVSSRCDRPPIVNAACMVWCNVREPRKSGFRKSPPDEGKWRPPLTSTFLEDVCPAFVNYEEMNIPAAKHDTNPTEFFVLRWQCSHVSVWSCVMYEHTWFSLRLRTKTMLYTVSHPLVNVGLRSVKPLSS